MPFADIAWGRNFNFKLIKHQQWNNHPFLNCSTFALTLILLLKYVFFSRFTYSKSAFQSAPSFDHLENIWYLERICLMKWDWNIRVKLPTETMLTLKHTPSHRRNSLFMSILGICIKIIIMRNWTILIVEKWKGSTPNRRTV